MVLLFLLLVVSVAPVVWIVSVLSSIRRDSARTVELLERAGPRVPPRPAPWEHPTDGARPRDDGA